MLFIISKKSISILFPLLNKSGAKVCELITKYTNKYK